MDKTRSVHYEKSAYWTPDRHAKARAMRSYRALWRGLDPSRQWALECQVYLMRGRGMPEEAIGQTIESSLNSERPWRLNDASLIHLLRQRWRAVEKMRSRLDKRAFNGCPAL